MTGNGAFARIFGNRPMLIAIAVSLSSVFLVSACAAQQQSGTPPVTTIANPASVNCIKLGGTLETKTDKNGGEYALCHLGDGTVCEEWALFKKQCP